MNCLLSVLRGTSLIRHRGGHSPNLAGRTEKNRHQDRQYAPLLYLFDYVTRIIELALGRYVTASI